MACGKVWRRAQCVWRRSRCSLRSSSPLQRAINSPPARLHVIFNLQPQEERDFYELLSLNEFRFFLESDNGSLRVLQDWTLQMRYILQMLKVPVHIRQEKLLLLLPFWLQ